jgi:histidyl-tRNA synthetase
MKFKTLKGIQDILPPDIHIWQHVEDVSRKIFMTCGYQEIRLPIIESTDIFTRSIGETTDIVEKEMYTFKDKGGRSVTLRPEGTAPFVRSYVEHHLHNMPAPQKYYYMGPMFRYERPQSGRYRQFYQIGAEALGVRDPKFDSEIISMLYLIFKEIGLKDLNFEVTSIGCKECRPSFREALKKHLHEKLDSFCDDCQRRYSTNPLRILDCKVPLCVEKRDGSPSVIDFLCNECKEHFNKVRRYLDLLNVPYVKNPNLVRGLDYYTKTAFEVTGKTSGSQNSIAAGGRYDRLVKEFGGPPAPGIGFAIGMERVIPLLRDDFKDQKGPELYICTIGSVASEKSLEIAGHLRAGGMRVEINYDDSSLRSQMRKADRIGAENTIIIGEDEIRSKAVIIKDMSTGEESKANLDPDELFKTIRQAKQVS